LLPATRPRRGPLHQPATRTRRRRRRRRGCPAVPVDDRGARHLAHDRRARRRARGGACRRGLAVPDAGTRRGPPTTGVARQDSVASPRPAATPPSRTTGGHTTPALTVLQTASGEVSTVDDWQPGDRVVLVHTNDPHTTLEPGDEGIVSRYTPITGELLVDWDSGPRMIMLPGVGDIIERA